MELQRYRERTEIVQHSAYYRNLHQRTSDASHIIDIVWLYPQSRQSTRLFSSRLNWDPPPSSSPSGECVPSPIGSVGGLCVCSAFLRRTNPR
jgi:hypothetical protein